MAAVDFVTQHQLSTNALLGLSPVPFLAGQPRQLMANDTHGRTGIRPQQHNGAIRSIVRHPPEICAPDHSVGTRSLRQRQLANFVSMKS